MKQKITSLLLVLCFAIGSVSMLNSCKDNEDDLRNEFNRETSDLNGFINELRQQLNQLNDSLKYYRLEAVQDTADKRQDGMLIDLNNKIGAGYADKTLTQAINDLEALINSLGNLDGVVDADGNPVSGNIVTIVNDTYKQLGTIGADANAAMRLAKQDSTDIVNLQKQIKSIQYLWSDSLKTAYDNAADAYAFASRDSVRIDEINKLLNERIDSLAQADNNRIDSLAKADKDSIEALKVTIAALTDSTALALELARTNLTLAMNYADVVANEAKLHADSLFQNTLDSIADVRKAFADADALLQEQLDALKVRMESAEGLIQNNANAITALTTRVVDLENRVAKVEDALAHLVTGLIVQSVDNPVYGTFALPINVQSNVLISFYGQSANDKEVKFPSSSSVSNYLGAGAPSNMRLTDDDMAVLGVTPISVPAGGILLDETEGNAGKIYVTVNPAEVDFTGMSLPLVNSQDKEAAIKLGALSQSDATLTFGYTKAAANGFYEANATLTKENIDAAKINIEPGLKSSMATILKEWKNRKTGSVGDYAELGQALYKQFNGILDRQGLKATWTDSLGTHNIYSQYNVAATAVKPLSYAFLKGTSVPKFPTISPINEEEILDFKLDSINLDNFDLSFNIEATPVKIKFDSVHFKGEVIEITMDSIPSISYRDSIVYQINPITHEMDSTTVQVPVIKYNSKIIKVDDLVDFVNNMNNDLNGMIHGWETQVNTALQEQVNGLIAQVNKAVEDMAGSIKGQLEGTINDMLAGIKNQLTGKLDKPLSSLNNIIARINGVINRVNNLIEDPNHYLQVAMFYQGVDGDLHMLSNSRSVPTIVEGNGAIALLPSSLTAELVAPAYKKFVAVTNVFDAEGHSAQLGNAACLAALQAANSVEYMNQVLEGKQKAVAFVPAGAQSGYVYEIAYSAMDYSGKTSTRKFYVRVK